MAATLNDLLGEDPYAEQVYLSLPEHVKRAAAERSEELTTRAAFFSFAARCCGGPAG